MNKYKKVKEFDKNILILLLFIPSFLISKTLDNDIWFILNNGRYVLNSGIPHIEPFTIHENMNFVMQQWLTSTIYWSLYNKFGEFGIIFIVMLCMIISVLFMYKITYLVSDNNFFVSYTLSMIFSIFLCIILTTRPMTFTILIIIIEIYNLEMFIKYSNKNYLVSLPLLSLLLVNLQAAMWPLLFIILIPYLINTIKFNFVFICCQEYEKRYLILVIVFMILIAFINPYGLESMTYLFRSYGYPEISNNINEMKPPNINSVYGIIIYILIFTIFFVYILYRNGKTQLRYMLLTLGTLIMALSSVRNFPFFIICALFPLAYYLKEVSYEINYSTNFNQLRLRRSLIAAISIVVLISFLLGNTKKNEDIKYLNEIVEFILNNEDVSVVKIYTGYNYGGYAEFKGLPSYIDPRAEVFVKKNNRKEDILKEYFELQNGESYYKEILDKYEFTHLIVSKNDILYTYLPYDDDYKIIKSNVAYMLFERIN